eukprot:scaffold293198_cov40-Attheya_sp.AAC.3
MGARRPASHMTDSHHVPVHNKQLHISKPTDHSVWGAATQRFPHFVSHCTLCETIVASEYFYSHFKGQIGSGLRNLKGLCRRSLLRNHVHHEKHRFSG